MGSIGIADFIPSITLALIRESESYQTDRCFFIGHADRTWVRAVLFFSRSSHYPGDLARFLLSQPNAPASRMVGVLLRYGIILCGGDMDLRQPA